TVAAIGLLGCGAHANDADEDTEMTSEAQDVHCALYPATPQDAKARIAGYIGAGGVATTKGTYELNGKSATFECYMMSRAGKAGIHMKQAGGLVVPRSELGDFYLAQAGTSYPFPILPALVNAPAVSPYNPTAPTCAIRHFLAAVLELDGAQGS